MAQRRDQRGWLDRLVGMCLSLMVAAIALSVAVTVIRPYFTLLVLGAGAVVAIAGWRSWQRSRW